MNLLQNLIQFITLINLGFCKVVLPGVVGEGGGVQFGGPPPPPSLSFIFQEKLVHIQYKFVKLLSNLSGVS